MPDKKFAPGFRMSATDAAVILAGGMGSYFAAARTPWIVVIWVIGHFFLFCNVFRIDRTPELIWSAAFLALFGCTLLTGIPGLGGTVALSLMVTVAVIVRETRKPSYHGVGWSRWNPDLPAWWDRIG
jgi:hypothetical protein